MANEVIQGDSSPTELPRTQVSEELLIQEKNRAKYSKSKEFKDIREYWEARKEFFKTYTPGGAEIRFQVPNDDIAQMWLLANNMINEIDVFLSTYVNAAEVVKKVDDVRREAT
jgi:hypothetical protein